MQRVRYTMANIVMIKWEAGDQHWHLPGCLKLGKDKPVVDLLWDDCVLLKNL